MQDQFDSLLPLNRQFTNLPAASQLTYWQDGRVVVHLCQGLDARILETQSVANPGLPDLVEFPVPEERRSAARRVWIALNAIGTKEIQTGKVMATVHIAFQKGHAVYEREYPLRLGYELFDSFLTHNPASVYRSVGQATPDIAIGTLASLYDTSTSHNSAQLNWLAIEVNDPYPVLNVRIEDLSTRAFRSKDPSLDVHFVGIERAMPSRPPTPTPTPATIPTSTPQKKDTVLCLTDDTVRYDDQKSLSKLPLNTIFAGSARNYLSGDCDGNDVARFPERADNDVPFTLPIGGNAYATLPDIQQIKDGSDIESVFNIMVPPELRSTYTKVHLLLSAHNLCWKSKSNVGKRIGSLIVHFTDGTSTEALPLEAGQNIRQGRTNRQGCSEEVLQVKSPNKFRNQGLITRSGVQFNEANGNNALVLDIATITLPTELRDRTIASVEVVDESLNNREKDSAEYDDPYLTIYAVTLAREEP